MWKSDRNLGVDMLHVGFYGERVSPVLEVKKRNFRHPSVYISSGLHMHDVAFQRPILESVIKLC